MLTLKVVKRNPQVVIIFYQGWVWILDKIGKKAFLEKFKKIIWTFKAPTQPAWIAPKTPNKKSQGKFKVHFGLRKYYENMSPW